MNADTDPVIPAKAGIQSFLRPQITPIYTARPSAGTKITSRQARQDRKEEQDKNGSALGDLCVFARDINPLFLPAYADRLELSGKDFQLLRVSDADSRAGTDNRQLLLNHGENSRNVYSRKKRKKAKKSSRAETRGRREIINHQSKGLSPPSNTARPPALFLLIAYHLSLFFLAPPPNSCHSIPQRIATDRGDLMTWLAVIRMIQGLGESDFYGLRLKLLVMNPYEMLWLLSLPTLLLWSTLRRKGLAHYLLLGAVYTLAMYGVFVGGVNLHFDLIAHWLSATKQPPADLESMLPGNGPKLIMAVLGGGPIVVTRYVIWLALLSPVIVLLRSPALLRRRKEENPTTPADGVSVDARPVLLKLGRFMRMVAETLLVLAVVAAVSVGPCVWESLRADAAPPARWMTPVFLVTSASYLATGLLMRALAIAWIAKGSRAPDVGTVVSAGLMSPFLKTVLAVIGGCAALAALLGWSAKGLVAPIVFGLLLAGGSILISLVRRHNGGISVLPYRLASLAVVVLLLYLFAFGSGVARLVDVHSRLRVALGGGRTTLQSWAVDILGKERAHGAKGDFMAFDEGVPKELWSDQIRRLQPDAVRLDRITLEDENALCLTFAAGLANWQIVIGPTGSVRAKEDFLDFGCRWLRWGPGIYAVYCDEGAVIQ